MEKITLEQINRDSNFELARIVSMIMIVIGHFIVHGIWQTNFCSIDALECPLRCTLENLVYSFCVCGVNVFVLISGYHMIKFKIKSLLSLWFLCFFYGILAALVNVQPDVPLWHLLIKSMFISNSQWFFKAYLWLFILSPILNTGLTSMSLKTCRSFVLILFILNCFSGWVLKNANDTGYNVLQLIFIYIIGQWLSREPLIKKFNAYKFFIGFVLMSIIICIAAVASLIVLKDSNAAIYYYNNPLVVLASVALFCGFSQLKVQSNIINVIAATVVAALFIQDFIAPDWIYDTINEAYNNGTTSVVIYCSLCFFLIFISAFIIETIRRRIFQSTVQRLERIVNLVVGR